MQDIKFAELPLVVRIMIMVSIFMVWVLFAEFVIDRYRWDVYIPYYRYQDICPYELIVIIGIGFFWRYLHRAVDDD